MLRLIGILCAVVAISFDFASYWKQIAKTLKQKHSNQVSSSSYLYKIAKIIFNIINLAIFSNFVGVSMEVAALFICISALMVIAHFKPKNWKLVDFKFGE
jgi:purine-nucleoside phosphorylase